MQHVYGIYGTFVYKLAYRGYEKMILNKWRIANKLWQLEKFLYSSTLEAMIKRVIEYNPNTVMVIKSTIIVVLWVYAEGSKQEYHLPFINI